MATRSSEMLMARMESALADPDTQRRVKENPQQEVGRLMRQESASLPEPLRTDKVVYRIVVSSLGATILGVVIGASVLSGLQQEVPDILTAIGSAAIGALAGLLAPAASSEE